MYEHLKDIIAKTDKSLLYQKLVPYLTEHKRKLFEEILAQRTRYITIAVEDVYHAHNSSALVRTADCFGLQDVQVIRQRYEVSLEKEIAKGAQKWMDINDYHQGDDPSKSCIDELRARGYQIVAATPHMDDIEPYDVDLTQKTAFFFGAEKTGISETVLKEADQFVKIPMYGFTESFNVSVACAIILSEVMPKVRKMEASKWALSEKEKEELRFRWAMQTIKKSELLLKNLVEETKG